MDAPLIRTKYGQQRQYTESANIRTRKPKYTVHNTVGSPDINGRAIAHFQYLCLLPGTKALKTRLRQNKGLSISVLFPQIIINFFVRGLN